MGAHMSSQFIAELLLIHQFGGIFEIVKGNIRRNILNELLTENAFLSTNL